MSKILNENNLNDEVIRKIELWVEYCNNGHYGSSKDIVDTYNLVFEGIKQKQAPTSCGSCLRRCVFNMRDALKAYREELAKAEMEKAVEQVKNGNPEAIVEAIKDIEVTADSNSGVTMTKKSVGRPRKNA